MSEIHFKFILHLNYKSLRWELLRDYIWLTLTSVPGRAANVILLIVPPISMPTIGNID